MITMCLKQRKMKFTPRIKQNHNKFTGKSIFMLIINKSIPCCWLIPLPVTQHEMSLYLLPTEQKTLFHAHLKRKLPLAFAGNYNPIFRDLP